VRLISEHKDSFIWTNSKRFLVKAMYNDLVVGTGIPFNCCTWKAKIPLKIKKILWCLRKCVILTKDSLAKRRWKGCTCFCSEQETIQHLFFIVQWLNSCGVQLVLHLVLENMQILPIFLVLGLEVFLHKHKNQVLINVVA
jgi:hypothetical protein